MERIACPERSDWRQQAERLGFLFHTFDGERYWDESAYYRFSLRQVEEDIEDVTNELHAMCMELVSRAVRDEVLLQRLAIPASHWDYLAESYRRGDPHLYGRMDLCYDGKGPAKLYELNYDTPTSLYESAFFQWLWLAQGVERGLLPKGADQFNAIQERLVEAFQQLPMPTPFYFASVRDSAEDRGTVAYLQDIAAQAGLPTSYIAVEDIGVNIAGVFTDLNDRPIPALFKLYPWEFMFQEEFAQYLAGTQTYFFEPPWKSILSNKGALALLWEQYPNHPNLLPTFIEPGSTAEITDGWVRKPFFSREGANIELRTDAGQHLAVDGPYRDAPCVRQRFQPLPCFEGNYTLIGSWVIGDVASGMGIREDDTLITKDTSRFLPHIIVD